MNLEYPKSVLENRELVKSGWCSCAPIVQQRSAPSLPTLQHIDWHLGRQMDHVTMELKTKTNVIMIITTWSMKFLSNKSSHFDIKNLQEIHLDPVNKISDNANQRNCGQILTQRNLEPFTHENQQQNLTIFWWIVELVNRNHIPPKTKCHVWLDV
jgi:hypothetical protein